MKLLLDTCTFLWIISDDPNLSTAARKIFLDEQNDVYLSSISTWEIAVKHGLGKLPLPEPPDRFIPKQRERHNIDPLPLDELSTLQLHRLPPLHKDPFDRMLICQAIAHSLTILTPDQLISDYPIRVVW
ncbi:MAG: type II toxin-antitoxin system VapC family toxin [Proteobacteria bacterium]|nr:type II toxin-antitoxin system VapC family toxin [Pseudomonadota bacterium]